MRRRRALARVAVMIVLLAGLAGPGGAWQAKAKQVPRCKLQSVAVQWQIDVNSLNCSARATLTAVLDGGRGPFVFQWYDGDILIGDTNPLEVSLAVGAHAVRADVTDEGGPGCTVSSPTETLNVGDVEPPELACPANIVTSVGQDSCEASVDPGQASAADLCLPSSVAGARSDGQPLDAPYPLGMTTIAWTARDEAGNQATCAQTVTVNDNQAPTLTCPGHLTTSADIGQCSDQVTFQAGARDNCGSPAVDYAVGGSAISLPHVFPVGVTTVVAGAVDGQGNRSTCRFNVTVSDDQAPSITCPADIAREAGGGPGGTVLDVGAATARDNCAGAQVSALRGDSLSLADPYPVGVTTITWTAEDAGGNRTSCDQTVTLEDARSPAMRLAKNGPTVAAQGDTVVYTFDLANDAENGSGAPLTQVTLSDDLAGVVSYLSGDDGDGVLEVGETWRYRASYTIRASDPPELINTATATARDGQGRAVTTRANHTLRLVRATLDPPVLLRDPHCAGWMQGYTVNLSNSGGAALENTTLAVEIPPSATFNLVTSSPGLLVDDATHAHWALDALPPGQARTLYLEVRASLSMAGQTLVTCFTLDADTLHPVEQCASNPVIRCETPSPTPSPTATARPSATPTTTPSPTSAPTATATLRPTAGGQRVFLPLILARK